MWPFNLSAVAYGQDAGQIDASERYLPPFWTLARYLQQILAHQWLTGRALFTLKQLPSLKSLESPNFGQQIPGSVVGPRLERPTLHKVRSTSNVDAMRHHLRTISPAWSVQAESLSPNALLDALDELFLPTCKYEEDNNNQES